MVLYVPGTEETDPKKQNMALQQLGAAATTLQTNIATNTTNIATNTTNIATNTANIATNTTNIATNTTNIASNTSAITALQALVPLTKITASLGADVALNNASNYFDGPSAAQGTTGTWFASGTVTIVDPTNPSNIDVKLWDGATVIASTTQRYETANIGRSISLSGAISSPAGNLRISCKSSNTTSTIAFNKSGNSKDSTLTALRIA